MEEFVYLQLKKSDLLEIHRALLARWIVEDKLRLAQGLEHVGPPMLLDRIEALFGMKSDEAHALFHRVEDELWEYSWHMFVEEWAWHRAEEDVHKELGDKIKYMNQEQIENFVEKQYESHFEAYIEEISLQEDKQPKAARAKRDVKNSKK